MKTGGTILTIGFPGLGCGIISGCGIMSGTTTGTTSVVGSVIISVV